MKSEDILNHIDAYIQALPANYDRPAQKFIRDVICGAIIARTTLISEIARAITLKASNYAAVYKRLIRRFKEVDFKEMYNQQQNRAVAEITDHHIIAIDIGDITKPHSKTLEGLAKVADGSDGHKIKPGYWLCGAVAINPSTPEKTPQPLTLELYSSESEQFYSENAVVNKAISDIFIKTNGKGTYVIDRGGDRSRIIKPLLDLNAKFVIRLKGRDLIDDEKSTPEKKVIIKIGNRNLKRRQLPYKAEIERLNKNGKSNPMKFRIGYKKVSFRDLKSENQLYLVTVWTEKFKKPMEILTSKQVKNVDDAIAILTEYLSRWSVEETYRFLKTDLKLEKVQVRTLGKIKNVIKLMFITASILARMTSNDGWKNLSKRYVKRQKTPSMDLFNWFYVFADVCSTLFKKHLSKVLIKNATIYFKHRRKPLVTGGLFGWEVGL